MFLSIIIPIYNVEKYLGQCVDSVLKQQLNDYEIILVDDGSPDNCPKICDDYVSKYDFIRVIHKENGGLSSARNVGIEIATGEYIVFMDSDDWWNEKVCVNDMLETVKANNDVEMFLFTSLDYYEGKGYFKRYEHEKLSKIPTDTVENYYNALLKNGNLEISAATKILKTKFIRDNNLFFTIGITGEDSEWMLRLLRVLHSVKILDKELYLCRMRRVGSITNTIKKRNIIDSLQTIKKSISYYQDKNAIQSKKKYEFCYCAYLWFSTLGLSRKLNKKERKEVKSLFNSTKEVCAYSNSSKTRLCLKVYKFFGYSITSWILGKYIKLKGKKSINKKFVGAEL